MTARQFYFVLITFVISLKIQRMPCLVYDLLGKDSYVLYLIFLVLDLVGIVVAFFLSKKLKIITEKNLKGSFLMEFVIRALAVFVSAYFLIQAILFYESIQDLFSHILFDNLFWKIFSLFLLSSMFFLASFKFENIGRVCEVFFSLIIFSLIVLAIFGGLRSDFTEILPFQTIFKQNYLKAFKQFNIWFGDFFLVLFLGVYAKDIKLKFTVLSYIIAMLFACLFVIEFNGIFLKYSPMQSSLVSVISEQSLLGIDIGRFDWFLILISEFGTVIGASVCLCLSRRAISKTLPKMDKKIILLILVAIIYFTDVFYLIDSYTKKIFFFEFVSIFALIVKISSVFVLILKIWHFSDKINNLMQKKQKSEEKSNLEKDFQMAKNSRTTSKSNIDCLLLNFNKNANLLQKIQNINQNSQNITTFMTEKQIWLNKNIKLIKLLPMKLDLKENYVKNVNCFNSLKSNNTSNGYKKIEIKQNTSLVASKTNVMKTANLSKKYRNNAYFLQNFFKFFKIYNFGFMKTKNRPMLLEALWISL